MTGVMGEILERYGQTVTLRSRDGEKSVRAFIQPAVARNETVPGEQTPIGWIDERLWRYTGLEEVQSGDIEAFGENEPVATIEGQKSYTVELTRLYATDTAISDGIDFYHLTDFSLVICKPDRKVIYSGCEWSSIQEDGELNATVAERVTLTAARRIETSA